jgi:hypothetical protein
VGIGNWVASRPYEKRRGRQLADEALMSSS